MVSERTASFVSLGNVSIHSISRTFDLVILLNVLPSKSPSGRIYTPLWHNGQIANISERFSMEREISEGLMDRGDLMSSLGGELKVLGWRRLWEGGGDSNQALSGFMDGLVNYPH
jgi:hypothetical protein